MKRLFNLKINGEIFEVRAKDSQTLLDVLREELGLTGTKKGCDQGECGSCTVLLDGSPVLACLILAWEVRDREIVTIEGLAEEGKPHPLQKAFVDFGAIQCGYCTPGMILSAKALLDRKHHPMVEDIKKSLAGNLCRCGCYPKIVQAIQSAAEKGMS